MKRERLALALSSIPFTGWADFEAFASEFLTSEFPELRTTARAAGDKGRDAEIIDLNDRAPGVRRKLQYSVTRDWSRKIADTITTLIKNGIKPTHLIYATNQHIGAEADELKSSMLEKHGVTVDIRDDTYFLDRMHTTAATQATSEELAQKFVDPLLPREVIGESIASVLTLHEERIAFLHLSIDLNERDSEKNLTKSSFESLVLAALHGSTAESRIPIEQVKEVIRNIVGPGAPGQVEAQIDNAISRLEGKNGRIKRHASDGTLHVAFEEQGRINGAAEEFLRQEQSLERDILAALYEHMDDLDTDADWTNSTIQDIRRCIEGMIWEYGEQFSDALAGNSAVNLLFGDVFEHYLTRVGFQSDLSYQQISSVIKTVLDEGSEDGRIFLGRLLESYTILALLKSTPDVQRTLRKVVSDDKIWVDTSFLLPLLADRMRTGDHRAFESLVAACRAVGIRLYVTEGVLQEIDAHLWNCMSIVRGSTRLPRYPYLLAKWIENGNQIAAFPDWQEDIRGDAQPVNDIAAYLQDEFGIVRRDLSEEVDSAPDDLRAAASDYWRQYHEERRGADADPYSIDRLVQHDVENVVGVLELRRIHNDSAASYRYWWLTLDRKARHVTQYLTEQTDTKYDNVAISPGFLAQLIRLAPSINPGEASPPGHAPILLDLAKSHSISSEVIDEVEALRSKFPGLSRRRIRRVIRDELNRQKSAADDERDRLA